MGSGQELFKSNFAVNFWNFSRRPRSDQVLCGSGHELIPVDREARKKLPDVNKYWILATTRKTYSLRPLCETGFSTLNHDSAFTVEGFYGVEIILKSRTIKVNSYA